MREYVSAFHRFYMQSEAMQLGEQTGGRQPARLYSTGCGHGSCTQCLYFRLASDGIEELHPGMCGIWLSHICVEYQCKTDFPSTFLGAVARTENHRPATQSVHHLARQSKHCRRVAFVKCFFVNLPPSLFHIEMTELPLWFLAEWPRPHAKVAEGRPTNIDRLCSTTWQQCKKVTMAWSAAIGSPETKVWL